MTNKAEVIKALCQTHLGSFTRMAFGWTHPEREYQHNWSMDVIGEALSRCCSGEIKRLIINMPPRSLKSFYASVAFPAWVLPRKPEAKIMCIAGSRGLADDQHTMARKLMKHPTYQAFFPHIKVVESGRTLRLAHGGSRGSYVASPGGGITGRGADIIVIDDPLGASHADDDQRREAINLWYDQNVYQRLDSKQEGVVIVVMQRLHTEDLARHLLKQDGWELLSLPSIAMEDEVFALGDGRSVGRAKGEALHPDLENRSQLRQLLTEIGAKTFMAQYQQDPYAPGQGDGYHGVVTFLSHPDEKPHPGWSPQGMSHITEERLVLDEVFGERMTVMKGWVPFKSTEDYIEWAQEYYEKLKADGHFDDWPELNTK